jgi:hypothetical protein
MGLDECWRGAKPRHDCIENRTGKPMIATEALPRTLRIGVNNPQAPTSSGIGFYFPFKNIKYRVGWPPSEPGQVRLAGLESVDQPQRDGRTG